MISIEGFLNKIIFHNEQNNYYILSIFLDKVYDFIDSDYITVVGNFENINFKEEELYIFKGNLTNHKKYGLQISAISVEPIIKKEKNAIISYLSSNSFQGIGKKTAEIIVDNLGLYCLEKIYENKNNLFNITDIPEKKKEIIYNTIIANKHTQDIILKLSEYGLSNTFITKIFSKYKYKTLEILNNNPYYLLSDIKGISFKNVDSIAEKLGISATDIKRISAALVYTLSSYCYSNGHTYINKNNLLYNTYNILYSSRKVYISKEIIINGLTYCMEENKISVIDDNLFLPEIHYSEYFIYENISKRIENDELKTDENILDKYILEIEKELNITYDIEQIKAIKNSINKNFSIITGGPGTGKTTIILGIIKIFQKINNYSYGNLSDKEKNIITLCAPTGKAAKKMTESTGLLATTIHKAIGWTSDEDEIYENHCEKTIKSKLVIIDEASMIDVFLMKGLLEAINKNSKIVLVGDDEQLPSISPGNILNDLIKSNKISKVYLNKIFRQNKNSSIINLSHCIKNNLKIDILENFADREFLICEKKNILDTIKNTYKKLLSENDFQNIQILAPIYKSSFGINEINKLIQKEFNNNDDFVEYGELKYKISDRVMQLVNRPEDNIFNGDIGIISDIFKEDNKMKIIIDYDNNFVTYEKNELNQITLSYACSIHKSQGSEFDYIIIPLIDNYNFMLNKNLIYTAITRTKKKLYLCGDIKVFYKAIDENNILIRNSYLKNYFTENDIEKILNQNNFILSPQNINFIDPMIGMENLKPVDFI